MSTRVVGGASYADRNRESENSQRLPVPLLGSRRNTETFSSPHDQQRAQAQQGEAGRFGFASENTVLALHNDLVNLGKCAVEPLAKELQHPDPNHRAVVATALGALGDPRAVEPLLEGLRDSYSLKSSEGLWRIALEALGKLGDPQAIDQLIQALGGSSHHTRKVAVEVLGELGDLRALDSLTR